MTWLGARGLAVVLVLIGAVAATTTAHAQSDLDEEQARAHFSAGRAAFSAGRYPDALAEFKKAYELSHRPQLLYNVGVAADRLRHDAEALEAFEAYLRALPEAPERAEVEGRIAVLRQAIDNARAAQAAQARPAAPSPEATASAAPAAEAEPPAADADGPGAAPIVLLVGGGVVAVTGGVLLAIALSDKGAVESPDDGARYEDLRGAQDRVPLFSTLGSVMLGAGVLAAGVGVTWLITSGSGPSEGSVQALIGPGALAVRGSF